MYHFFLLIFIIIFGRTIVRTNKQVRPSIITIHTFIIFIYSKYSDLESRFHYCYCHSFSPACLVIRDTFSNISEKKIFSWQYLVAPVLRLWGDLSVIWAPWRRRRWWWPTWPTPAHSGSSSTTTQTTTSSPRTWSWSGRRSASENKGLKHDLWKLWPSIFLNVLKDHKIFKSVKIIWSSKVFTKT